MPHVLYHQQAQSNTAVDDVTDENRADSMKSYPEITALGLTPTSPSPTRPAQNTDSFYQKARDEESHNSFSPKRLRRALFQQTLQDPCVRESCNPSTFSCSGDDDNDIDTPCQQQTNIPASMVSKNNASQPSLFTNDQSSSTIQQLSPVQNQAPLPGAKKHCRNDQIFESKVEELKEYIEKNGHMKITKKENKSLNTWISKVKRSFNNQKQQHQRQPRGIRLDQERMEMLKGINFDFGQTNPNRRNKPFESSVEELKEYIKKNGHMKVTKEENKSLNARIFTVKKSFKNQKQQGQRQPGCIRLDQERMEMLKGVNFNFEQSNRCKSFESSVEELKEYIEKNGHMKVTKEENRSLYDWITNVKRSLERIQEGKHPNIYLSKEHMEMLKGINFNFRPKSKRVRDMECGKKRSRTSPLAETKDDAFRAPKVPRHESINTRQQKMPPTDGTMSPSTSQLSFQSFESSVEERRMYRLENNDPAGQYEEEDERIEIEGDLIPRWLLVGDDQDHDHDQETTR